MHSVFTGLVALPTLLTVFTICASAEIASRLRGGRGAFGWVGALPWQQSDHAGDRAVARHARLRRRRRADQHELQLDASIHNTQWITGHFHLIFGGAIVIMYFAIAYDLWPHLTGRALRKFRPDANPALAVVHRHDGDDVPVALCRHPRHAAPHGVLRLRQSGDLAAGVLGVDVGDRRLHSADLGHPVSHRADPRPAVGAKSRRAPTGSPCPCTCRRESRPR